MGSKLLRRGFGAVVASAAACALALPGTAHAVDGPDPILAGDCAATLDDAEGGAETEGEKASAARPLTADAGALAQAPGVVTAGLGSESPGTNGHAESLVALPVSDTLDNTGVTKVPAVSDAATASCELAKPVANDLGATVQNVVPGDDVTEPGPGTPPNPPGEEPPESPPEDDPGNGDTDDDTDGADGRPTAPGPGAGNFADSGAVGFDLQGVLGGSFDALGSITLPPAAAVEPPVRAPDLEQPPAGKGTPGDRAKKSGTAHAAPTGDSQHRLPLLFAVIALAVVVAALSKRLSTGKSS